MEEREREERGEKELTRACIRVYEVVHERVHHLHIVAPLSANDSSTGDGVCVPFRGGRIRVYVRIYVYRYVCRFFRFASGYWSKVFLKAFFTVNVF